MITNPDSIREQLDIVEVVAQHVNLQKKGVNHIGLCPCHNEKTPSFTVSPNGRFFKCFGWGKSGDVLCFQEVNSAQTFTEKADAWLYEYRFSVELTETLLVNGSKNHHTEKRLWVNVNVCKYYPEMPAFDLAGFLVNVDGRILAGLQFFTQPHHILSRICTVYKP